MMQNPFGEPEGDPFCSDSEGEESSPAVLSTAPRNQSVVDPEKVSQAFSISPLPPVR